MRAKEKALSFFIRVTCTGNERIYCIGFDRSRFYSKSSLIGGDGLAAVSGCNVLYA